MNRSKKILILGGEGFIGRNIINFLGGRYNCYSIGIEKSKFEKRKDKFIKKNPYRDKIKNKFDVVIHLIDNPSAGKEFSREEKKLIKNLELNRDNHLIIFSSAVIYADPGSKYGKRKKDLEKIYLDYCDKNGIKLTIFRLFNAYGPYQIPNRPGSLVANIFHNYLNKKPTQINDKKAKRDFIFAGDIGKFIDYAVKNKLVGTFDICANKLSTVKNILDLISKIVGKKISIINKKTPEEIICPAGKNVLTGKIKLISLEQGLKKTYAFCQQNSNTLKKSQHENI